MSARGRGACGGAGLCAMEPKRAVERELSVMISFEEMSERKHA